MGWKLWKKKAISAKFEIVNYPLLVQPFYAISITLLSLLLPLSFLLLARLSSAHYLLSLASISPPKSLVFSLFLNTNPNILHALVSVISLAALIHALTGRISLISELPGPIFRPRVHAAWIFLCTLQVCVGLGIEATIKAGVDGAGFGDERSMLSKLVFFLGLHETMIHWSRTIVRPVVDDTIFGGARQERMAERWALAACFGALSWWRLRDEVESLVVVVEVKREMMMKVGLGDFLGLWLYYLTVAIGLARIIKSIIWFGMTIFKRRVTINDQDSNIELIREDEDKV
ncbi:uncharacterized protein LOC110733033 [Chenopodium quinoa]|uniref:uncharacterized protein LOC110733033 n=1 Tax=Chenopodium quinoa TaxID=63459 RepID=UPI000B78493D|nr:uncharacterized protein LOC110733033 [Chenopodium quinoa]